MKKAFLLFCALGVFALAAYAGDGTIHRTTDRIAGSYLAILDPQSPAALRADAIARAAGVQRGHVYDSALNGFAFRGSERAAEALCRRPDVVAVYEDGLARAGATQYNPSAGLDRLDQRTLPLNGRYIYNNTGIGVRVYIIDSGVNAVSDLAGRIVENISFPAGNTSDCAGHGTPVASIAAGTTYGVAKSSEIANVRVLGCDGMGPFTDIIAGINYVRQQKVNNPARLMVANISIWGPVYQPADDAVINLVNAGVAVALIAGNGNGDDAAAHSPGRIGSSVLGAVTTGATEPQNDFVAVYSSQGTSIDLFAPGNTTAMSFQGNPIGVSGTSSAAPYVAGVMAKHLQSSFNKSAQNLETIILSNANTGVRGRTLGSPDRLLTSFTISGTWLIY